MQLSKRLMTVASLVQSGGCVADVGTDHGYIPIYLVQNGKAASAVAMDVRPGPLERARQHVQEAGLEDRIFLRLGDGLEKLKQGEADTLVIAGMGGMLMARILGEYPEITGRIRELVLSPQSDHVQVRRFLCRNGFQIAQEKMLLEDGKFYTVMRAVPGREEMTEAGLTYGPRLLEQRDPVLAQYIRQETEKKKKVIFALELQGTVTAQKRREELIKELELAERAEAVLRGDTYEV